MTDDGLTTLEDRVRAWLDTDERAFVRLHWDVDGRLLLRLRVEKVTERLRWTWLEDDDPTRIRRDGICLADIERIITRQLLEPGGERLLLYRNDEASPSATFRAVVCAGDRLRCVWE
jgi:hypothetical protein